MNDAIRSSSSSSISLNLKAPQFYSDGQPDLGTIALHMLRRFCLTSQTGSADGGMTEENMLPFIKFCIHQLPQILAIETNYDWFEWRIIYFKDIELLADPIGRLKNHVHSCATRNNVQNPCCRTGLVRTLQPLSLSLDASACLAEFSNISVVVDPRNLFAAEPLLQREFFAVFAVGKSWVGVISGQVSLHRGPVFQMQERMLHFQFPQ